MPGREHDPDSEVHRLANRYVNIVEETLIEEWRFWADTTPSRAEHWLMQIALLTYSREMWHQDQEEQFILEQAFQHLGGDNEP